MKAKETERGPRGTWVSPEGNQVRENENECSFLFLLSFLS